MTARIAKARALRPGDRVRLVAPASPFDRGKFRKGVAALERLGFEVVWDPAELARTGFLAGSDGERAERLGRALLEADSRAVWAIRGGYGVARLLPLLDLQALRRSGKLLVGFSDLTALLVNLARPGGTTAIHGPVVTQLGRVPEAGRRWLARLISDKRPPGPAPLGRLKRLGPGRAEGRLVGGNLSLLASLVGTPWLPSLRGTILILEEVAEQAYRLDRLWTQLVQSGSLRGVRGVVLGSLAGCKPDGRGRWSARGVLERAVADLDVPAVSGAAFGHEDRNLALPLGVRARLDADRRRLELLEAAVR